MAKGNPLSGLSNVEYEIMRVLWDAKEPLSTADIFERAAANSETKWDKRTTFLAINRLADKGLVKMDGVIKRQKTYPRTFSANISLVDYMVDKVYCVLSQEEIMEFQKEISKREKTKPKSAEA